MDAFVRRLIQRLFDPSRPLSRNRHFHAFDNPEGRYALKTSRRLRSLQREILACHREGHPARVSRRLPRGSERVVELLLEHPRGKQLAVLAESEFELLRDLPGVAEALSEPAPSQSPG